MSDALKGQVVVVNLQEPREKLIGILREITPAGVLLRGLDVESFPDWLNQAAADRPEPPIAPTTVFFPMHRIVRIYRDEDMGAVPSFSTQFEQRIGTPLKGALS